MLCTLNGAHFSAVKFIAFMIELNLSVLHAVPEKGVTFHKEQHDFDVPIAEGWKTASEDLSVVLKYVMLAN